MKSLKWLEFSILRPLLQKRKLHLGYRDVTLLADTPFGFKGMQFKGHEFHYASVQVENGNPLFHVSNAAGIEMPEMGLVEGNTFASFIHLIDKN